MFSGGSSTASTKSATIEMYVGSSTGYNDTMSGETMSSISEKSGSYISEEHHHGHHVSVGGHGGGHHHRLHHQQLQQQPQHLMQTTEFDVWPFKASAEVKCFLTHYFSYRKKTYEYPHCLKLSNSRVLPPHKGCHCRFPLRSKQWYAHLFPHYFGSRLAFDPGMLNCLQD